MNTLVFISGLGINAAVGLPLLQDLATASDEILLLDLPPPPDELLLQPLEQQLHYIASKLQALIPNNSIVIGWSLGGLIATVLSNYAPQKISNLIIIASSAKFKSGADWECIPEIMLDKFNAAANKQFENLLQHFARLIAYPDNNYSLLLNHLTANQKTFLFYLNILINADTRAILLTIKIPTLYIFGEQDAIVPLIYKQQIKTLAPKIKTVVIPNAGHIPFVSHTTLTSCKIKSFIATSKISLAFNKAHRTYDSNCEQQLLTSKYLIQLISSYCSTFNTILELGCGTGNTSKIAANHLQYETMLCTDIAENLINIADASQGLASSQLVANFDALPVANNSVNLCLANMTLQWSYNIKQTLKHITNVLATNGILAFSLPTTGTFAELNQAIIATKCPCFLNHFDTKTELLSALPAYKIIKIKTNTSTYYYPDIFSLLQSIKKIGGTYLKNQPAATITKSHLLAIDNYFQQAGKQQIPLTYQITYFIGVKI